MEDIFLCSPTRWCKTACKRTQHCWPTTPSIVGCYMLRPFAHPVACCWMLLRDVAQSLKPVKLFSQQLLTFLLFRDPRSVAQQCWICLLSSSNIVKVHMVSKVLQGVSFLLQCKTNIALIQSIPEPARQSGYTCQRIHCFDRCQLITTLMGHWCAICVQFQFAPGLPN